MQAIILTGSREDAYATDEWNMKLREIIKTAHDRKQRILGHCFGCQITTVVLGGNVGQHALLLRHSLHVPADIFLLPVKRLAVYLCSQGAYWL